MRTKFQRITAFVLTLVLLLGGQVAASADYHDSMTDVTIESMKDLLGAMSYDSYREEHSVKNDDGSVKIDETTGEAIWEVGEATKDIVINGVDYDADMSDAEGITVQTHAGIQGLYVPGNGSVSWKVNIKESARYTIKIEYFPVESNKNTAITRIFKIGRVKEQADLSDGVDKSDVSFKIPFSEARFLTMSKVYKNVYTMTDANGNVKKEFIKDIYGNELRPDMIQAPEWRTYVFKDVDGFSSEPFEFIMEKGDNWLTLDAVSEAVVIKSITLCAPEEMKSYADVMGTYAGLTAGSDSIFLEAEHPYAQSSQTIYPIEDRTSPLNSPYSTDAQLLNVIGADKWQVAGQWISYQFTPTSSGLYEIATRFKQKWLDGMYSSRALYIYSNGDVKEGELGYYDGLPYAEATEIRFGYNDAWQSGVLYFEDAEGKNQNLKFYLKEGVTYTIEFEVTLGAMGDIVSRVQKSLEEINKSYLNIIKLTGTSPDQYRDYGFFRVMPETMINLIRQSRELYKVSAELTKLAGEKSSNAATLDTVAWLLEEMGTDEDDVARNLDRLKNYIGTLGTWISDAKTQPLQFDYLVVQGADCGEIPAAKAGFFKSLWHEVKSFIASFFRDYNHMGAIDENAVNEESLEVWLAYGRDQSQVIRTLINNDFTPSEDGCTVDLKLVAGGTLLPSILAGKGPDVYIGLGQGDVINYAIRGALDDIYTDRPAEFTKFTKDNFTDAAMLVLGLDDNQGNPHYYGLPETQDFPMMFVRLDTLADLDIEIPKTWDDLLEALPKFQANNMEIGLTADTNIYLYQMGGTLFADGGMRINLDSNVGLDAFTKMCNMYTMYSFPYTYNFANRFRTGEMPIGIGSYCATYNTLVVFATEIRGLWQFFPLPGTENTKKEINNCSVSAVTAVCMIAGSERGDEAWEFMKWQTGAECQAAYSNEMVAILGDSAKHPTANRQALDDLTWTDAELTEIQKQFNNLAAVPNYPGAYIVARYTNFAFLAAYDDKAVPSDEILGYIDDINKEITRKRNEFGLEVLEFDGKPVENLALKRRLQTTYLINNGEVVHVVPQINSNDTEYIEVTYKLSDAVKSKYSEEIARILKAVKEDDVGSERLNAEILEDLYEILPDVQRMADDTTLSAEDQRACDAILEFINGNAETGIKGAIQWYENYKLYE